METVIGIAHYNTPQLLFRLMQSIVEFTGERAASQAIVWDDGSENKPLCVRAPFGSYYSHPEQAHLGVHPTFNALFSCCLDPVWEAKWLCFLGSDTQILKPNWIKRWQQGIEILEQRKHVRIGMAAAMIVDETGHILFGGANEGLDFQLYGAHKFYGALPNYASSQMSLQPWLTGTALMIRAEALADVAKARIGLHGTYFDEDYQIFCGDRELSYQMRSLGWSLGYIPAVQVLHSHGGSQSVQKLPDFNRDKVLKQDEAILYARWSKLIEGWEE